APPRVLPSFPTRRSSDLFPFAWHKGLPFPGYVPSGFDFSGSLESKLSTFHPPLVARLTTPFDMIANSKGSTGSTSTSTILEALRSEEHTSELQSLAYLVC